jgi:hypothetical protein
MDIWLTLLLVVAVVAPIVWFARRKDARRERAEFEAPEDIFDAPVGRTGISTGSGRAGRTSDNDRHESDAGDGGDGGGGGGGD